MKLLKQDHFQFLKVGLFANFIMMKKRLVDMKPSMKGILAKLQNPDEFRKVYVDKDAGTVAWPENFHFDPDTLYNRSIEIHEVEKLSKAYDDLQKSGEWKGIL